MNFWKKRSPLSNKYNAKKTGNYDSNKEARYALMLKAMMNCADPAARVTNIEEQVKFEVIPKQVDANGKLIERAVHYIADFRVTYGDGRVEVVDAKGYKSGAAYQMFVVKRKLMLHVHGIKVIEV